MVNGTGQERGCFLGHVPAFAVLSGDQLLKQIPDCGDVAQCIGAYRLFSGLASPILIRVASHKTAAALPGAAEETREAVRVLRWSRAIKSLLLGYRCIDSRSGIAVKMFGRSPRPSAPSLTPTDTPEPARATTMWSFFSLAVKGVT
ncbi:hypothetical protein GWI33_006246 [Rhynchophorus ferrugineus]|uniref:Uncharacterized protein n=1 Tax=Rhynchophorus ferrugineus TaxID=354439 RepID=A0A834IGA5_RHYFE|nr:hypothetical protein GWI33_006246 [Rhynchophorus ferrugineus]